MDHLVVSVGEKEAFRACLVVLARQKSVANYFHVLEFETDLFDCPTQIEHTQQYSPGLLHMRLILEFQYIASGHDT